LFKKYVDLTQQLVALDDIWSPAGTLASNLDKFFEDLVVVKRKFCGLKIMDYHLQSTNDAAPSSPCPSFRQSRQIVRRAKTTNHALPASQCRHRSHR
jgi:hypothetical protein